VDSGLSLILAADWYNVSVMKKVKFFDENTRQWWMPDTGGANIPALNDLLSSWGMAFSDEVYEGEYLLGDHEMYYASGSSLARFPKDGLVVRQTLKNQGQEVLKGEADSVANVPILGLYQPKPENAGRVVLYGDSNCLDTSHLQKDCFWLLEALLDYAAYSRVPSFLSKLTSEPVVASTDLPQRMEGNHLYRYSKVLESHLGGPTARPLPPCPHLVWSTPVPLNKSGPSNLYKSQKLLSVVVDPPLPYRPANPFHGNPVGDIGWGDAAAGGGVPVMDLPQSAGDTETTPHIPVFALLGMVLVACYGMCQWYRNRNRPRRRKNRLRRIIQAAVLASGKLPTV